MAFEIVLICNSYPTRLSSAVDLYIAQATSRLLDRARIVLSSQKENTNKTRTPIYPAPVKAAPLNAPKCSCGRTRPQTQSLRQWSGCRKQTAYRKLTAESFYTADESSEVHVLHIK